MGSSRNARATVAMTGTNNRSRLCLGNIFPFVYHSLAVQTANSICIESKKKNITRSEIEAPSGKHNACVVSRVAKPESMPRKSFKNN